MSRHFGVEQILQGRFLTSQLEMMVKESTALDFDQPLKQPMRESSVESSRLVNGRLVKLEKLDNDVLIDGMAVNQAIALLQILHNDLELCDLQKLCDALAL